MDYTFEKLTKKQIGHLFKTIEVERDASNMIIIKIKNEEKEYLDLF